MARNNTFKYKITTENINSIFLIDFFNEFVIDLKKPTVIVLDNAKIHHSKAFKSWIKYWQDRGLFFVYLPPYSPELNIIEKLWFELKQRYIKPEDYTTFESLLYALKLVLMTVGNDIKINFKQFGK